MVKKLVLLSLLLNLSTAYSYLLDRSCSSYQKSLIKSDHDEFVKRVNDLLDPHLGIDQYQYDNFIKDYVRLENRIANPKFKQHQKTYIEFWSTVKTNLLKMKKKANTQFQYRCQSRSDRNCKSGVYAYVPFWGNRPQSKIVFCDLYFRQRDSFRHDTLLHEHSHMAASTIHVMSGIKRSSDIIHGANDAYLYGRMRSIHLESLLKLNAFGWLWIPKR